MCDGPHLEASVHARYSGGFKYREYRENNPECQNPLCTGCVVEIAPGREWRSRAGDSGGGDAVTSLAGRAQAKRRPAPARQSPRQWRGRKWRKARKSPAFVAVAGSARHGLCISTSAAGSSGARQSPRRAHLWRMAGPRPCAPSWSFPAAHPCAGSASPTPRAPGSVHPPTTLGSARSSRYPG